MARPPSPSGPSDLVQFDPTAEQHEDEEIYEVNVTPAPREQTPPPAPQVGGGSLAEGDEAPDIRSSIAGRLREGPPPPPRASRAGLVWVALGALALGCAGVLGTASIALIGVTRTVERAAPVKEPAPEMFEGVPVERGFRRSGDEPAPAARPDEPAH
ncbi:MAG: hypothetical protein R3F59_01355 [Myxococcota bacterium]